MANSKQIGELVRRCEDVQSFAAELKLDFLAFLSKLLVTEARMTHYLSLEDAAAKQAARGDVKCASADAPLERHRASGGGPHGHVASVTPLNGYRKARLLKLASGASQKHTGTSL